MDNVPNRSSSNYDLNSNQVRKSLFVLNSGKVIECPHCFHYFSNIYFVYLSFQSNLNVNAVSFPSTTRLPSCPNRSRYKVGPPNGLLIQCNPRIWRNISCRNFDSVTHDGVVRQPSVGYRSIETLACDYNIVYHSYIDT